jgi:hypothetical protein
MRPSTIVNSEFPAADPKRSAKRRWVTSVIVVGSVAAAGWYLLGRSSELAALRRLSLPVLLAALLLQFGSSLAFNDAMRLPLQHALRTLGFWEFYMVRTGGLFVGSLVPLAGNIAVRLAYLRSRGLTYGEFTWGTVVSNVMALAASAALAIVATSWLWVTVGRPASGVLWLRWRAEYRRHHGSPAACSRSRSHGTSSIS